MNIMDMSRNLGYNRKIWENYAEARGQRISKGFGQLEGMDDDGYLSKRIFRVEMDEAKVNSDHKRLEISETEGAETVVEKRSFIFWIFGVNGKGVMYVFVIVPLMGLGCCCGV